MTPPDSPLVLTSATARLEIDPARGGRMTSLVVHGSELLVTEGMGPIMWGCFPMAPFAGRIRDGAFDFDGRAHRLPLTMPPNAIHGTVLDRTWATADAATLSVDLGIDLGPEWPFAGRVRQRFVLGRGGLKVTMTLEADEPMPATIGWHPWFRRELTGSRDVAMPPSPSAQLQFDPSRMYERGTDGLPTGLIVAPSAGPWDDCFTELRSSPRIVWPGRLALELSSSCDHWVVYTEPDHAICVEPQSGPPDAANIDPRIVRPGTPLVASMTWHWWKLD